MSKILNLTQPEKSDIKYKISKFPDGQQQIVIENKTSFVSPPKFVGDKERRLDIEISVLRPKIEIKSRLNNFQDLELIICATKSLRNLGVKEIHLFYTIFLRIKI